MIRVIGLGLTALTGFSGLVYEVAWQKYVATLLGSHSEATAAVLALFLGGLSAGYALFGRVTRLVVERSTERGRPPRLLLLYGLVEAAIGLHALAFPWLFAGVRALSVAIPHRVSGAGFALDVGLVALLILPPTILMGATIPILTQALSRSLADSTRLHALVYASNTAGAFAGALSAGFVLVPTLGLANVVYAMGVVNLVAGAGFGLLGLRRRGALGDLEGGPLHAVRLGLLAPVALLAGFAAMALQTVLIRVGGLAIGSSEFTFSMVVAVFVLCIAVGSFVVSALPRIPRGLLFGVQVALAVLLVGLYRVVADAPYWVWGVRSAFRDEALGFYFYFVTLFLGVLAVLAVPIGLSGATLPLVFHQLRQEIGGLGSAAGRLYAWNTLGSLLGALLGGYWLLFWLDLDQVFALALGAVIVSAVLLAVRLFDRRVAVLALLPALAVPALLPRWDPDRLSSGLFRERRSDPALWLGPSEAFARHRPNNVVSFYTDDPASSVAVFEAVGADGSVRDVAIATNGKPDGAVGGDYPTMALAGLIPALFAERAESAFVIGYGTGVTVGELAALDTMRRVVVAEISPGVIEAGRFFEARNLGALGSPKTEVVVSDAYRALRGADERFDVIVSEPSNPWMAGVEMLFSREFLAAARDRLTPGGVYAQWFHLYEVDDEVVSLVLRTYLSVFERVAVWFTLGSDVILLGFNDPDVRLDLDVVRRGMARADLAAGLQRARIDGLPALLAHEILPVGVVERLGLEGDVHTLLHPILNDRAARAFFAGGRASLPRGAGMAAASAGQRTSLLAQLRAESGGRLPESDYRAAVDEVCGPQLRLCASLLAAWALDHPGSPERERVLEAARRRLGYPEELAPALQDELLMLHGVRALPPGRVPIEEARRLTGLFVDYAHSAVPFDRAALAAIWRQCRDSRRGVACAEERRRAERLLGSFRGSHAAVREASP